MTFGVKVTMVDRARQVVREYTEARLDVTEGEQQFEVFVVWFSKTLKNWKALLSTTLADGMYYEVTYDGEKGRIYLDAYKKFENKVIPD